jgi:hypothetical protein
MNLKNSLKQNTMNLFSLIKSSKKQKLAEDLEEILKNDFEELRANETYTKNFLELVSYIYAHEQLLKQKSNLDESLDVTIFNKDSISKLELLRNNYVHNASFS